MELASDRPITVALVWAQFSAYHIDRCEAVARRLAGRAAVSSIEIASASRDYAWEPSGEHAGIGKVTLFPGRAYEAVGALAKLRAAAGALRGAEWAFIGLSYAEPWVIALTWWLRFFGTKVVLFSESKADDRPRRAAVELAKRLALACYHGAIVGARRHVDYFRSLGFGSRKVLPGYDGVGVERIRNAAGTVEVPFDQRPFVFVGRFVEKKNLLALLEGFAHYARQAGGSARKLVLAGSGELEGAIRDRAHALGIVHLLELPGFLSADAVPPLLDRSLALVLVSREEQWGLVVNEALAVGRPVIVSPQVGARDALVREGENGFVVDPENAEAIGEVMLRLGRSEAAWQAMCAASREQAWMGDADRLADAVEVMLGLPPVPENRLEEFCRAVL